MPILLVSMILFVSMRAGSLVLGPSLILLWIISFFLRLLPPPPSFSAVSFLRLPCYHWHLPFVYGQFLRPRWAVVGLPKVEGLQVWVVVIHVDSPPFLVGGPSLTLETV